MTDKQYSILDEILAEQYTRGYEEADSNQRENAVYAYERGLNEAWECTRKLVCTPEKGGYTWSALEQIFNTRSLSNIIDTYTASEAISKIKKYEEKQKQTDDEIKVGDEIERIEGNHDRKYIVTKIIESDYINIIFDDGGVGYVNPIHYRKTGRHFPHIEEMLKQMQEEEE